MANITWNNNSVIWNSNSFTWDANTFIWDLVQEILGGGGIIEDDMPWMKPERREKLIKLILRIKGETLTESKTKQIKQYKIKAKDVRLVVKEVNGIELTTENISF